MRPLYELTRIEQGYNGRSVLQIAQLAIEKGEILALVGPSGAGKSTLLRLLAFLERPLQGEIRFEGELLASQPPLPVRRQVTMVFQQPLLLRRTVRENLFYGLWLRGERDDSRLDPMLDKLGLLPLAQVPAHTLSGGELQRVALGRALLLQPKVLLLDEPTANLDPYNIKLLETMVREANRENGMTVVIVTHNIFQARRLSDRVGLLLAGQLVEVAPTGRFFEQPERPETAAFVNGDMVY